MGEAHLMDADMEKVMGKAFMPAVRIPQRVGHMSVHPGSQIAPADRAPVTSPRVSSRDESIADLRREIFKLEETTDRLKSELESVRSQMAIMERAHAQNRTHSIYGF